ncbi:hypothetical protein GQ55_7G249200 [Panicum hallii var. hallii]|uniref:Uncharacterized protein n=2 Tax=Panicum hallii TaxID=206008 RepID=A0A2T7CYT5_9POAL|nr:hypothetical protein GQ55_7G249200 [Panicum hallii var. hallii]PVH35724.1 hypothetical protein PAHAL_7G256800 [Panicum hallii]
MTHEVHSSQPAGIPRRNAAEEATMGGSPGNGGLWGLSRAWGGAARAATPLNSLGVTV